MRNLFPLLLILVSIAGCTSDSDSKLDADRILQMAGDEAGLITAPKEKLTRQLNIANRETQTGKQTQARATLAAARQTLENAKPGDFPNQQRLAGWISLSELARKAEDKPFASAALDQALKALNDLKPQQARCEYVLGVEHELRELRGDAKAAELLATAGDWAMSLVEPSTRRAAFLDFAQELFACNDYEGARTLLRMDEDPAWRSDTLMAISDRARNSRRGPWWDSFSPSATIGYSAAEIPAEKFSKRLDFESNYQRR